MRKGKVNSITTSVETVHCTLRYKGKQVHSNVLRQDTHQVNGNVSPDTHGEFPY